MKTKLLISFVLGLMLAVFVHLSCGNNKSQDNDKTPKSTLEANQVYPTLIAPDKTPFDGVGFSRAYQMGYEKGYYSFLIQNSQEPEKITSYTTTVENLFNNEDMQFLEAVEKGYVDGYHKACNSVNCPR